LLLPGAADFGELGFQIADGGADFTPVGLQFGFARASAYADASLLALELGIEVREARQQIGKLGQRNLQLAFAGLRALAEDVENELCAVNDAALERFFQVTGLHRREFAIHDHEIGSGVLNTRIKLLGLTGADEISRIGAVALLIKLADDHGSCGLGQGRQLFGSVRAQLLVGFDGNQDRPLLAMNFVHDWCS